MNDIWEDLYKLKDIDFTKEYKLLKLMLNETHAKNTGNNSINEVFSFNSKMSLLNKITSTKGTVINTVSTNQTNQSSKRNIAADLDLKKSKKAIDLLNINTDFIIPPRNSTNKSSVKDKIAKEIEFRYENPKLFKTSFVHDSSVDKISKPESNIVAKSNSFVSSLNCITNANKEHRKPKNTPKHLLLNTDKKLINSFSSIRNYSVANKVPKPEIFKKNTDRRIDTKSSNQKLTTTQKNVSPSFAFTAYNKSIDIFSTRKLGINTCTSPFVHDTRTSIDSTRRIQPYLGTQYNEKNELLRQTRKSCLNSNTENIGRHDNSRHPSASRITTNAIEDFNAEKFYRNTMTNKSSHNEHRQVRYSNVKKILDKADLFKMKMNRIYMEKLVDKKPVNYKHSFERDNLYSYDRKTLINK